MVYKKEVELIPSSQGQCRIYGAALTASYIISVFILWLNWHPIALEREIVLIVMLISFPVAIALGVLFCAGAGSDDERFQFISKGKYFFLVRTSTIYFDNIKEVQLIKNEKEIPFCTKVITTDDKIYYIGQSWVITRFLATLSAKKMSDKIREIEENISPLQRFKYWWRDGDVEDIIKR